jgi:hypothetical protein
VAWPPRAGGAYGGPLAVRRAFGPPYFDGVLRVILHRPESSPACAAARSCMGLPVQSSPDRTTFVSRTSRT